jgi:hypothetical protein
MADGVSSGALVQALGMSRPATTPARQVRFLRLSLDDDYRRGVMNGELLAHVAVVVSGAVMALTAGWFGGRAYALNPGCVWVLRDKHPHHRTKSPS